MSYLVLARKYRSGTFDQVVGQEHAARTLKCAIETDRIAHAFLFCGTRGVGKTSMARILAKALNCEKSDKPTPTPCGKCNSCLAVARGDDMDVIEIDAASNTQVDKTRELIENCRFRPARSRFKVYIIDEVHMLSKASFNALLKTLEEPPSHVKFILATTETEKIPATILSRCQRYDFRNIPTREIAAHLKSICRDEKVKADDDALFLLARAGAGSMRDALSLLDRMLSLGEEQLTIELIEQLLGMPRAQVIFDLAGHIGAGETKSVLLTTDKIINDGLAPETLVSSLSEHFRNLLVLSACGKDSDLVEVAGIAPDEMAKQAAKFEAVALTQSIAVLDELRRGLRSTSASRAMLDATLVRLTLAGQFTRIQDLLAGAATAAPPLPVEKKKSELIAPEPAELPAAESTPAESAPAHDDENDALPSVGRVYDGPTRSLGAIMAASRHAPPRAATAHVTNVEPVDQGEFAPVMLSLRAALARHGAGFDGILVHGQIIALADGQAVIRFGHEHEASAQMLQRNGKKEKVQEVLGELLSSPVGLTVEIAPAPPDEPARAQTPVRRTSNRPEVVEVELPVPPPAAAVVTQEQKEQLLQSDPLVRTACELFGGEIVKIGEGSQ